VRAVSSLVDASYGQSTLFRQSHAKFVNHSLVETIPGSFHLHPCLHDWLLAAFNDPPNQQLLICAATSVHRHLRYQIGAVSVFRNTAVNGRMMAHLERLRLPCFRAQWVEMVREENFPYIACIFPSICMRQIPGRWMRPLSFWISC
jgi:hypothetical protein